MPRSPAARVATVQTTAQQAYSAVLKGLGPIDTGTTQSGTFSGTPVNGYWSVGPLDYQRTAAGALVPRQVANPSSVWVTGSAASAPMDDEDSQYRTVTSHVPAQPRSWSAPTSP